jgi:YidC/Oxa1 family membrane protein insertase
LAEISNPNQQGSGDNKSLIAMMVVMVAVFFGLQAYRAKTNPQTASPSSPAIKQSSAPAAGNTTAPQVAVGAGAALGNPPKQSLDGAPASPAVQATAEQTTTVENELYKVTFTNRGGLVTSWLLKGQTDTDGTMRRRRRR